MKRKHKMEFEVEFDERIDPVFAEKEVDRWLEDVSSGVDYKGPGFFIDKVCVAEDKRVIVEPASRRAMAVTLVGDRSEPKWVLFPNGDVLIGYYPKADTYEEAWHGEGQ